MNKRIFKERMIRRDTDDGSFNLSFWKDAGAEARFAATWEMVAEARLFKGLNGSEPRLQRSVQNIQRRKS